MMSAPEQRQATMDTLHVSLDSGTLDAGVGKRKLRSIEADGSLTYDEEQAPEAKLTEVLGRIWSEYPNGMLDISEANLAEKDPDAQAAEDITQDVKIEDSKETGDIMTFDEMGRMRDTILAQLNQSRNELWFVLEMAKSLHLSSSYTNTAPPAPSLVPRAHPPKAKPNPDKPIDKSNDPPILPPGTFSSTPSKPPTRQLVNEVIELETALAAKQAALEQCGLLIDSAVDELTNMSTAGDRFWQDVRRLKEGLSGRGQWAVVPKPDFGGVAPGQKAKDIIIPYAIDEASASMRARCLAAFDLDPKKKELAFGARTYLRLKVVLTDENGMATTSTLGQGVPEDAEVGEKMEEAQMESFDEELFNELRGEVLKRANSVVEARSIQFDIGDQNLRFELVDTQAAETSTTGQSSSSCDLLVLFARLSFLQALRNRKRRSVSTKAVAPNNRPHLLLSPLIQILQYTRLATQVTAVLETLQRTLSSAGIESRLISQMSLSDPEVIMDMLEEGSLESLGGVMTLDIPSCSGIMIQTSAPNSLVVNTSRATFPLTNPFELMPIISESIAFQLLSVVLPAVLSGSGNGRHMVFIDEMEEVISLGEKGSLSVSIPAPYDAVQATVDDREAYDSRHGGPLVDWASGIMVDQDE